MNIKEITPHIAAMYLGQKCDIEFRYNDPGDVFHIGDVWHDSRINGSHVTSLEYNEIYIILHLRRLESITNEEARELHVECYGYEFAGLVSCIEWLYQYSEELQYTRIRELIGFPPGLLHLLSKGFDLFGLIDAGLAKETAP